ncbi:IclR family transcriptional regulator C-terminal domain-containing protein [Streptomyces sp. NPDC005551]|uniref:IclR family transcriptional regulator domain-containing protein n=1 Tax=Streptomyces sp. NPDC005551 TaxID=3364725 RepID=UPI0036BABE22
MPSNVSPALDTPVPDEAVAPLMRGIAVLRRLTDADGVSSLSGLERATGLARSTVDRITATLARMGYVRLDGRDAVLAPRLMELGNAYLAALRLPRLLAPHADALADELDESVSLAVGDLDGIRFIHQATRRRAMSLSFRIGDLLPAERTAPGPLFATEWGPAEWAHWHARRDADPEDRGFPAVPARSRPIDYAEFDEAELDEAGLVDAEFDAAGESDESRGGRDGEGAAGSPHRGGAGQPYGDPAGQREGRSYGAAPVGGAARVGGAASEGGAADAPRRRPALGDDFERRTAEARETGWALDDQLIEQGLVALSVPVRDPGSGRVACVVSVVSHTSRHTAADLRDTLLPRLRTAVAGMEEELRRTPPAEPADRSGLAGWTGASKQELGREFIESLARGLTVFTAFDEGRAELTLSDIAQATGLPRATARRALITLEHLGYVTARDRVFGLTPRVLGLGFPPLSRLTLPQIATPYLSTLSQRLQDSASLAILAGDDIQYTARVATRGVMSVNVTVGTRLPAYATSLGRVMLADLPDPRLPDPAPLTPRTITDPGRLRAALDRVRAEGYALVDEELEEGLRSIAVPVRDGDGRVVAAVNVAMHSSRRTAERCVTEVLPELHAAATRIETDLRVAGRFRRVPGG